MPQLFRVNAHPRQNDSLSRHLDSPVLWIPPSSGFSHPLDYPILWILPSSGFSHPLGSPDRGGGQPRWAPGFRENGDPMEEYCRICWRIHKLGRRRGRRTGIA
eukprot:gene24143-biopygen5890